MRDIGPESRARGGGTTTSTFGVSRRENHDASAFYERFAAPVLCDDEEVSPHRAIDQIFCRDARHMAEVDDKSVALVVTSPPYFAGKEYETALGQGHVPATYADYLQLLQDVFAECVRTLEPGGRIAVNVANLGRRPFRSLSADVIWILQDRLRLLLRGEVVWIKGRGATGSCAWGSFQSPTNPVLRDLTERVVIASKGRFDRARPPRSRARDGLPATASISRDEFMEATTDVWEIASESATRVGHPAPFPVELPERLIHLYTFEGDLVLDPFMGVGSAAVAAIRTNRHFVGYDTDPEYVRRANERVRTAQATTSPLPPPAAANDGEPFGLTTSALRQGHAAREVARVALEEAGFTQLRADVRLREGIDVSFAAVDRRGQTWHFDLAGAFTNRPGLQRADVMWKALAKAGVLHEAHRHVPFVLLTTELPVPRSATDRALRAVLGPAKPVHDVVALASVDDLRRLQTLADSSS